jgi:hypothetical protein
MRMRAIPLVRRVRPRHAVALVFPCIVLIGMLGADYGQDPARIWDLGKEHNLPSAFSALLLCVAGGLALLLGEADRRAGRVAELLGLFLIWMALNEAVALHERPEDLTGVAWPVFWFPVMLVGAVLGLRLLRLLNRPAALLFLGGAAGWLCAPVLDLLQEGVAETGSGLFEFILATEELAELVGSMLFVTAMLEALRVPRLEPAAA